MKTTGKIFWTSVVAASILLTACASTKFISVWKDDAYPGNPDKIMVVAESEKPVVRRLVEEEFVKELKKHETDAIASYDLLPGQSLTDKDAIYAKARESGADAVLVTRLVGRKVHTSESAWITYEDHYVDTTTDIYDMKSGKQIWIASSQTWRNENISDNDQIRSFVKAIIQKLSEQKLIKQERVASNTRSS
jgi:hypothetical protein